MTTEKVKSKKFVDKFILTILSKSKSGTWKEAVKEWKYLESRIEGRMSECLCGQAIREICIIYNDKTGQTAEIGNHCINHFLGDSEIKRKNNKVFSSLKRLKKSPKTSVDSVFLFDIYQSGILTLEEFLFYIKVIDRKKITSDEAELKIKINAKIKLKYKI
jgi:hypothetical protein